MEIELLRSSLRSYARVALDSCIFIYQWEDNTRYSHMTDSIFAWLERREWIAVTSTVTMTELLVHPYRNHDQKQVNELFGLFSTYPHLEWVAPSLEVAALAAQIRAQHQLRTPDALQAATAIYAHATAFITNDPVFDRIDQFETLVLDRLL